jgi:hypothetical protein
MDVLLETNKYILYAINLNSHSEPQTEYFETRSH